MMKSLTRIKVVRFLLYVLLIMFFARKISHAQKQADHLNMSAYFDYDDAFAQFDDDLSEKDVFADFINNVINITELKEFDVEILPQEGKKENDRVKKLPGQPCTPNFFQRLLFFINWECTAKYQVSIFEQYGGYVTVDKKAERALFYYFVEVSDPSIKDNAPLILWLNGGPGCSSIGYGAFTEIGPFRVASDGSTLYENIYAWNKVANVLFLESPVGVGYSYSNTTSDLFDPNDKKTARDSYAFLLNWLERFPEYKNKDFYIMGESYSGHFVPQLATVILAKNKLANNKSTIINLKGISLGNPTLEAAIEEGGKFEYLFNHGLISSTDIDDIRRNCNFSVSSLDRPRNCSDLTFRFQQLITSGIVFLDNLYAPSCNYQDITPKPMETSLKSFDPCTSKYVNHYLNSAAFMIALGANYSLPYAWIACRDELNYVDFVSESSSMLPLLQNLMKNGVRVLLYSGDFDGIISISSTLKILEKFNLTEEVPWTPWNVSNQVAGNSIIYKEGLTFTTIRGAGHEVPSFQPEIAFIMMKSFLKQEAFPQFKLFKSG